MKINDLFFGVMMWEPNKKKFEEGNIFDSLRVKSSVARYVVSKETFREFDRDELLFYLFGDTWGRVEWEFMVGEVFEDKSSKTCVYDFFVKPNKNLLIEMVNEVSVNSATEFLRSERKRLKR